MTNSLTELQKKIIVKQIPLNRIGEAKEVAKLISFIVSDKGSLIVTRQVGAPW